MKQAEILLHQLDVDQPTGRRKSVITAYSSCIPILSLSHVTINTHKDSAETFQKKLVFFEACLKPVF